MKIFFCFLHHHHHHHHYHFVIHLISLGGHIAATQLLNPSRDSAETLKGLAIDVAAVALFAFLYSKERSAKNAQLARLLREESLSELKLRVDENRVIGVSSRRGVARLVAVAGPGWFVEEAFRVSGEFNERLLERGVLVVPFVTDGESVGWKSSVNKIYFTILSAEPHSYWENVSDLITMFL